MHKSETRPVCRAAHSHTYGAERDTMVENRAALLPGKRIGTAEEVAQVMLMLMTNKYISRAGSLTPSWRAPVLYSMARRGCDGVRGGVTCV